MSVRKLTNVQQARRVLRQRRDRCEAWLARQLVRSPDVPAQFAFGMREVAQIARRASRGGVNERVIAYRESKEPQPGYQVWDFVVAQRVRNGRVRVWIRGERFSTNPKDTAEFVSRVERPSAYIAGCGPCSPEELVAVDALLETGDRYAERLAKQCQKGGILEGVTRKRRRK